ncbi:MAG TPA: DUF1236 domain-containing protein [Afifellaceae bacterium]|nr:DUF1236 domain-containing protein [Afifellaceae bacterium]
MKSRHLMATAALIGAVSFPAIAAAQQLSAVATTDLNMRSGPGPQFEVITAIDANAPVTVLGCTEARNWCQVEWQGQTGWAYAEYLQQADQQVILSEAPQGQVPVARYEGPSAGTATGAVGGAIAGAAIGGPVGAIIGGVAGASLGATIDPPDRVVTYVREQQAEPVFLEGEVVVGARLPETVTLHPIPEYEYHYAVVNRQPVLVRPGERQIVYIVR